VEQLGQVQEVAFGAGFYSCFLEEEPRIHLQLPWILHKMVEPQENHLVEDALVEGEQ
jgi:hypothetical protein